MNYMKEVAQMLGVELDEEFKVEEYDDDYTFKLTKDGLYWMGNKGWQSGYFSLTDILCDRIEIKKPILDENEKEYLSAVIKPFRNCVNFIFKYGESEHEFIVINYYSKLIEEDRHILLPAFEKGKMYKGMKFGKEYTLEELGL